MTKDNNSAFSESQNLLEMESPPTPGLSQCGYAVSGVLNAKPQTSACGIFRRTVRSRGPMSVTSQMYTDTPTPWLTSQQTPVSDGRMKLQ